MAARTSIIDESADDGVPADFWNEVLDSFDVMDDEFQEGSEEAKKAQEERARKKKEEEEEKVKRFNEAWNIAPAAEEEERRIVITKQAEPEPVVEKPAEPEERAASPEDCTIIQEEPVVITIDEEAVKVSENSVVVIPAEGQPKDPRLKRLEETNRNASPSSPTQESSRSSFTEDPPQRYFQVDRNREREREEQLRKEREREDFERARNLLRSRSPGTYLRRSMSDEEDDIGRRIPRRRDRSRSRRRSRSHDRSSRSPSRRNRRSRSRSRHGRSRSRRPSKSRSRSRSRSRRPEASSSSSTRNGGAISPTSMMAQMQAMMQMMSDPTKNPMLQMNPMMANPMMAMMMNPMMMMAGAGRTQVVTEEAAEKMDRKDELTAQLFLENKINLTDYLSSSNSKKKAVRSNDKVSQRIKEAISILDKQETKIQSSRFLYVAPTYHKDLKKLDNRSPLIWNEENVLYASTSKSKDVALCEPFRNVNHKMKQMIERLGLDEGNISQRIAKKKNEEASNRAGADVGTIQAITIVPVRGGAASKRIIDRSVQTDELNCLECVQRRNKTFISVNTQTAGRSRMVEISVQTDRDRDIELNSMNELNANQVKILNEIMKYMKKRQVSGNITNLLHSLERDAPELRNQHLSAGLHYVTEIHERNERNANRYANPNPLNPAARDLLASRNRDPRGSRDDDSSASFSMVPAGFRASPPRHSNKRNNSTHLGTYNRSRPW